MNDKIKGILLLLLIVSVLLLMIGSVNAISADEINNNLETSQDLNEDLSINVDDSILDSDSRVSNQITVSNADSEPLAASLADENLTILNPDDVVSKKYDAAINSKDSENNILASGPNIVIIHNKALNPTVSVGSIVSFEIFGRNLGSNYAEEYIPINMLYDHTELEYAGFTVGVNPDTNMIYTDSYPQPIVNENENKILFGYHSNGWFDNGHCFNFTVHFKTLRAGDFGNYVYINDFNAGVASRSHIVQDSNFVLTNTPSKTIALVGSDVSFEIFVRNLGSNFDQEWIPIDVYYNPGELEYTGFTVGVNPDTGWVSSENYAEPVRYNDHIRFNYRSGWWFDNGHCLNFTAHFKALKESTSRVVAVINWYQTENHQVYSVRDVEIKRDADFYLTNTPSKSAVSIGNDVSFEIFVRNLGGNFDQEWIPIDVYYNPGELEYTGFTVGVNPDTGWVSSENYPEPVKYDDHIRFNYRSGWWFDNGHCLNFTAHFKALKESTSRVVAVINWRQTENHQVYSLRDVVIKRDSDFFLTNTPSKDLTVVGGDVSFEIFVRNLGSNFDQEWIPIDVYYNAGELEYTGFTVGVNPDTGWVSSENYAEPVRYNDHIRFNYRSGWWFDNGHCLNFTAHFKALSEAQSNVVAVINWYQTDFHQVYSVGDVRISRDSDFKLDYKSKSLFVNVEDDVAFEVVGRNIGSTYYGEYVGVKIKYNPEELEYAGFAPGKNPDNGLYYVEAYPAPIVDVNNGEVLFGYATGSNFQTGYSFNFTAIFKSLKEGKVETTASMDWWQIEYHHVEVTNHSFVTDADFVLENTPKTTILSVGDTASFKITAHNRQGTYYGSYIGFDLFYDPANLEYVDYEVIQKPNGNFALESGGTKLTKRAEGLLFASESEDGHLHFGYTPTRGVNGDYSFDFDVNFQVLQAGKLENTAVLSWAKSETQQVTGVGLAYAGELGLNLTKTVHDETVGVGDDVYYDVCLVNNGTLYLTDSKGYFFLDDWYPEGLEYVDYVANTPGITVVEDRPFNYVGIKQAIPKDGWAPGSILNVTLHFKAVQSGILCNYVFGPNGTGVYSSVIVNDTDLNLTKTVREEFVQLNELVYFNIFVENNGSIPYYNHYNSTKDLVIYDYYPDGLEYKGFEVVSDSQGGKFKVQTDNGSLNITYTPDAEKWYSGSYINMTLIFNATKYGKFTNQANVRWIWKDWDEFQEIDLWDNATVVVCEPEFTISKISNYDLVEIGNSANFTIIVTNTGKVNLTGVYIQDNDYTEGLVYLDYSDKDLWTFNGIDTWNYKKTLNVGESASLELTFQTTTVGEKNNTAIAGHNITDEKLNSTDKVNVRSIVSFDFAAEEPIGSNDPDYVDDVPEGDVVITVPEDIPDVDVPDDKVPTVDIPDAELPDDKVPTVNVSDVELPDNVISVEDVPDAELLDDNVPTVDVPDVELPDNEVSAADISDVELPDDVVPTVNVPDVELPDDVISVEDVPDADIVDVNFIDDTVPINKANDEDNPEAVPIEDINYFDVIPDGDMSAEKFPSIGVPDDVPSDEEIPPVEVQEDVPSEEDITDDEDLIEDISIEELSDENQEDGIKNDTEKNIETTEKMAEEQSHVLKKTNQPVTGNPLLALILCLISLCFVQIKTKK